MNRPVSRRSFLGTAAASPILARKMAGLALEKASATEAIGLAGAHIGPPIPDTMWGRGLLGNARLYALFKSGLLPDWAMREVNDHIRERAMRLSPDIVALKSVSLSAKIQIEHDRQHRRYWASIDRMHLEAAARQAFFGHKGPLP